MATHRIAVIGGDGIGPEVIDQTVRVLDALAPHHRIEFAWTHLPWGCGYYRQTGQMLPPDGFTQLRQFDAILFGAVGSPDVPDQISVHQLLLPMRRLFDQYVNLRPAYLFAGVPCPLVGKQPGSIDMLVYRENTEGEYSPVGGRLYVGTPDEIATQTAIFTRRGCERIMRAAFEAARRRRRKVTSITKSNALVHTFVLWDETFRAVAADYPDVQTQSLLVDAAAMDFVRKPESFDVVVASNLFGDILTDLSAMVTGSVGLAASANINPQRTAPSLFEPVHGSAPDIAGQGKANPLAAILSGQLMLEHLGEYAAASHLRRAVEQVLAAGQALTPDLGGTASTKQTADAVIAALA
jgi:tartrate dehydrogenase/decarboxylase/D-malate dehydrogenase